MLIVGIDPGISGAICVIDLHDEVIRFADFKDFEFYETGSWLVEATKDNLVRTYIETPSMRPGNARGSDTKTYFNYGQIISSCRCYGFAPIETKPQDWQRSMRLKVKSKDRKKHKGEIASQMLKLYPSAEILGPKGGLKDGRSDALAIANYGKNIFFGKGLR